MGQTPASQSHDKNVWCAVWYRSWSQAGRLSPISAGGLTWRRPTRCWAKQTNKLSLRKIVSFFLFWSAALLWMDNTALCYCQCHYNIISWYCADLAHSDHIHGITAWLWGKSTIKSQMWYSVFVSKTLGIQPRITQPPWNIITDQS